MKLIDKDALVAEIEKFKENANKRGAIGKVSTIVLCNELLSLLDTLEVIDPYEQCIQYASIECGIKAHAEDYSFNIESELFNQLTKEQQALWRKEIEQACISGGYNGLDLAKDPRYKENLEAKEVDLEKIFNEEYSKFSNDTDAMDYAFPIDLDDFKVFAKHFFEFGLKVARKGE